MQGKLKATIKKQPALATVAVQVGLHVPVQKRHVTFILGSQVLHPVSTKAATDVANVFETCECYAEAEEHLVLSEPVRRLSAELANNPGLFGGMAFCGWRYVHKDSVVLDFCSENASLSK